MSFSKSELITPSGIRTHYLEAGSGAPVLLLHGSGPGVSAEANWAQTIPTLAKNFHVYAPDMAGFGESGWPSEDVGIKLWVRQLIEFIDALDLKPVCAVGNSFGGGLALAATLRFPDHFRRLVLMGTPAGSFPQTEGLGATSSYEPTLDYMKRALKRFPFDPAIVTDEMVKTRHEAALRQGGVAAFARLMPPPAAQGTTPMVRGVPEDRLRTIKQPTLIVHGREDRMVPVECALLLHNALENSELHMFGQCGHWVQLEHEARFVELLRSFLGDEQ